jgi:hypothetical protein
MYTFSPENQLVIAACSPAPDIAQLLQSLAKIDNWDKACTKLIKKGVAPLFLEIVNSTVELQQAIPAEVRAKLQQAYLMTVSRSMVLFDAFREIAAALNDRGIKAVALKGIYLAEQLYPKIGMRQFSDIDLLFRQEDVEVALEVFGELGYRMVAPAFGEVVMSVIEPAHLPPLTRKGVSVELHTRLHSPTQIYRLPEQEMADRAEEVSLQGQAFRVFEVHDLLIHLCLHLDKHFNGSHMQLYSWADIARLLAQRGHELNGEVLWQRCVAYKAEKEVMKILGMVQGLMGVKLPEGWGNGSAEGMSVAALQLFEKHLDDRVSHEAATQTHLFYLRKIKSPWGKVHYLREVLLPGKRVMVRAYQLKKERWYWMWYPYRIWVGLKGLFWKRT